MVSSSTTLQQMEVVSAAACPKCRLRLCTSLCAQTAHEERKPALPCTTGKTLLVACPVSCCNCRCTHTPPVRGDGLGQRHCTAEAGYALLLVSAGRRLVARWPAIDWMSKQRRLQ